MRNLAIFVALGWFWLTFYSVGPLTTWTQVAVAGLCLAVGGLASVIGGIALGMRRRTGPVPLSADCSGSVLRPGSPGP